MGENEFQEICLEDRLKVTPGIFLKIKIEPEEIKLLAPIKNSASYTPNKIGFINPSRIISYKCGECNEEHNDSPRVSVYIYKERMSALGQSLYNCSKCNSLILSTYLFEKKDVEPIPLEYIKFDASGDFVKPIPKSIEEMLKKVSKEANGNREKFYSDNLEIAKDWANKINYTIPEKIIKDMHKNNARAYISRLNKELPDMVGSLLEQDCYFNNFGDKESEIGAFEIISERFYEVYNHLHHFDALLTKNPELKNKVHELLKLYQTMNKDELDDLNEERKKLQKSVNKKDKYLKSINKKIREFMKT